MTDLHLYNHIIKYCSEIHKDGMCFVSPYNYEDFVKGLEINDSEQGFEAYVSTDGTFCFSIDSISHMMDDFDSFKDELLEKAE